MAKNSTTLPSVLSIILTVSLCAPMTSVRGQAKKKPDQQQSDAAKLIEDRTGNGIFVDNPKVYDDSSLQLMLNSARARLATLQAIDQTGLLSRIGAVTGASLSQSALGISITGPPIPQSVVTDNAPTGSTTSNGSGVVQSSTTSLPVQGTVTTNPTQIASPATAPANGGLTMPTPSISALDALNEQMQLTYEIANLQLLLEGSLNDRYVKGTRLIKPRTTLGFPVTISSLPAYKDAVAVVEVQVTNPEVNFNPDDKPAVTALLPRERTYNVAALTDSMTSIGGGVVTKVINGGFSFLKGRKSYYIVQDQDTLASMQAPAANNATTFSWQFRPVLGKSYVKAGMKQTFVQLSAPLRNGSACFGKIKVMTYWRQIDRKTGVLKKVIPESIEFPNVDRIIPVYDLTPFIEGRPTYDDLGSGQIRVTVPGKFLAGTFVRVGNNYYREGSAGFTADLNQIRFVASAAEVIKYKAYLVNRDGSETEIVSPVSGSSSAKFQTCNDEPLDTAGFSLSVADSDVTVTQGTQANFRVRVTAASNVSPTVQLSATGVPSPNGGTNWTVPGPAPAKGTAVSSIFSIDTTGTPVGTYVVQLQANGSPHKLQVVGVNLTVRAPVPQPTVQAAITSFDDTKSIVRAVVINRPVGPTIDEYLMVVNDKVFGLADAPLERDSDNSTFRAVVPTSLVSGPTKVQMIPLFWGEDYKTKPYYETSTLESTVDKVVVLDKTADPVVFLLYGSRLTTKVITHPGGVILNPLGNNPLTEIGTFTLSKAKWADTKQIVLQKAAAERPVFVTMPTPDPQTKIVLAVGGRVVVGTDELVVTGDTFDKLTAVKFNNGKTSIDKVVSDDKKSVKIVGLVGKGVTTVAGEPELVFEYDAGKKVTLKLDVVSSKIETVPRP